MRHWLRTALIRRSGLPAFEGGTVSTAGGNSHVTVKNHAAELLHELTTAAPFKGIDGCNQIDNFKIHLAPIDPTPVASLAARRPRDSRRR
jgi:hypothetical protein